MISFINSWAKGIIFAVVIATIIEIILPNGNNKKYIKTVIGIYILFVILYPLISKAMNKKMDINAILGKAMNQSTEIESKQITLETNNYIEKIYKEKIKTDIAKKVEEKGYNLVDFKSDIELNDKEKYGSINNLYLEVSKGEINEAKNNLINGNEIEEIKKIDIEITDGNKDIEKKEEVSKEELDTLSEYISNLYEIPREKIHINEVVNDVERKIWEP